MEKEEVRNHEEKEDLEKGNVRVNGFPNTARAVVDVECKTFSFEDLKKAMGEIW